MDSEDIFTIIAVIAIAIVKILPGFLKFKREKSPAEPSESMREILESLKRGESRKVVITRDDGKPVRTEVLTDEEVREIIQNPPAPEPPAPPVYDANADAALLEEQQRYAALAAQAEASLAARTPGAYDMEDTPEETPETHGGYAAHLPDFVRTHARDAVALSIILSPPPGLAK